MKSLKLFLFIFTTIIIFNGCNPKGECDTNNYGTVTITNNLDESFAFDVSFEQNEEGEWLDNYKVEINVGQSYTWTEVTAGSIRIWLYLNDDNKMILEDTHLSKCDDRVLNYEDQCKLLGLGKATVKNVTNLSIIVDVRYKLDGSQGYIEEIELEHGDSATYNLPASELQFWAREIDSENWTISDSTYYLTECDDISFTWDPTNIAGDKKK